MPSAQRQLFCLALLQGIEFLAPGLIAFFESKSTLFAGYDLEKATSFFATY